MKSNKGEHSGGNLRTTRQLIGYVMLGCTAASCSFTPKVTASYYFPKAETQVSIVQTLVCIQQKDAQSQIKSSNIQSTTTVSASTAYSSDRRVAPGYLKYSDVDGAFSDADVAVNFTDDGRLSGINSSSAGQGSAFIKSATAFAATVAPMAIGAAGGSPEVPPPPSSPDATPICGIITRHSVSDTSKAPPSVTLTYNLSFIYVNGANGLLKIEGDPNNSAVADDEAGPRDMLTISPDSTSMPIYTELTQANEHPLDKNIFNFKVKINNPSEILSTAKWEEDAASSLHTVPLELNRVAIANLEVDGPNGNLGTNGYIWKGQTPVPVPDAQTHYRLPIPKAALFGKQSFALALSGYGSIDKLEYSKNTGASDTSDTAGALAKAIRGPTAASEAAMTQAKSDLIYQNQRLALCRATPASCTSK